MRICPVCADQRIDNTTPACETCIERHYKTCNYLATYLTDLDAIATKKASTTPRSLMSNNSSSVPFPVRIKAWETAANIRAHVDNVIRFNRITVTGSYAAKLKALSVANIYISKTYSIDMRGFVYYAKEMQTLLTPQVAKICIGSCTQCKASVWAAEDDTTVTCSRCGAELNAIDVKARMLKSLRSCKYTATTSELVAWLKSLGIKTSKRSIQRWCKEGRIHAQNIDNRGTKLFTIGDVLKQIKMAQSD